MKVFSFFRKFALPCSLVLGALGYLIFANVPFLQPLGDAVGPRLVELMPVVLFALLYVTFCKIEIKEMKPKAWHFVLQLIRTSLALLMVIAICPVSYTHLTLPTTLPRCRSRWSPYH